MSMKNCLSGKMNAGMKWKNEMNLWADLQSALLFFSFHQQSFWCEFAALGIPDYAVGSNGTGYANLPTSPAKRHYDDSVNEWKCQDGFRNKDAARFCDPDLNRNISRLVTKTGAGALPLSYATRNRIG